MAAVDSVIILPGLHLVTSMLTLCRIATVTVRALFHAGLALNLINIETFASLIYNHFL